VELASLEGKVCWGLHDIDDYKHLLEELGLSRIENRIIVMPIVPGYATFMCKMINEKRSVYVKRWGEGVNGIIDSLVNDLKTVAPKPLSMAFIQGRKE